MSPIDPRDRRRTPAGGIPRPITEAETSGVYENPLEELTKRARSATRGISDTNNRLTELERAVGQLAAAGAITEAKVKQIDDRSKASDNKLDQLITNAEAERETRETRLETAKAERAAERQRREERDARIRREKRADRKSTISAVGAVIATLLAGVAAILAATHGGGSTAAAAPTPIYVPIHAPPTPTQ